MNTTSGDPSLGPRIPTVAKTGLENPNHQIPSRETVIGDPAIPADTKIEPLEKDALETKDTSKVLDDLSAQATNVAGALGTTASNLATEAQKLTAEAQKMATEAYESVMGKTE